jgi:hypothetical protein
VFGKDEQRQLADMRRSGAVEGDAGSLTDQSNKMTNMVATSAKLRKTANTLAVRRVDEAHVRGARKVEVTGGSDGARTRNLRRDRATI